MSTRWKKPKSFIPVTGVLFLLSGCASNEGLFTQGHIATPASLSADKALANDGTKYGRTWPAPDWWRALNDTQLDALIGEALQGNPDLLVATARIREAGAMAMNADAARYPSISAMATVQGIHIPGSVLPNGSEDQYFSPKAVGSNASYRGDLWGGERAAWEAAVGRQRASEIDANATRLALSAEVARAYARLAYAWQANDLMRKDAERAQRLLALTAQRVAAGIDDIAQQRQAEALEAAARQRLMQADQAIRSEQIALAILIGKGPDRAAEITRPNALQPIALSVPENLPAELLGRRPDIVAARWRVEAARRDIDAAQADFYPSFNLTAAIGLASFHADDLLSLRSRYYAVAPAVSLPIFDGGRLRASLAGRNAEYDIAVAHYNKALVGALNEVALRLQEGQSLAMRESTQQQAVNAAQEAWALAMLRYRRGIGSHIEALTAQQSVLATEAVLATLRAQQVDTAVQLVHALGGGYAADSSGITTYFMNQDSATKIHHEF